MFLRRLVPEEYLSLKIELDKPPVAKQMVDYLEERLPEDEWQVCCRRRCRCCRCVCACVCGGLVRMQCVGCSDR